MNNPIKGKRILLVCYNLYEYHIAIKDALWGLGAKDVHLKVAQYFPSSPRDDHFWKPWYRIPQRYFSAPHARTEWTNQFIQEIQGKTFDVLLVIENTAFKKTFISYLRKTNPGIKTVWVLWDTFKTQQKYHRDYIPLFDKVVSFDRDDAKKYHLEYFPLFYLKPYGENKHMYDICYIGHAIIGGTSYRIDFISKLKKQSDALGLKSFYYVRCNKITVQNPLKKILRKIFPYKHNQSIDSHIDEGYIHEQSLPLEQFGEIMRDSDIVVDINHSGRQGLTMNAILGIVSGKKLITTNYRVVDEDFYHPNNILVVDENNPIIPQSFVQSKIVPRDMSYLKLDNWLKHILNF